MSSTSSKTKAAVKQPDTGESKANPGLTSEDKELIAGAERALKAGVELKQWWERIDQARAYEHKFEEAFVHLRREDGSFGFFENASLEGGKTKVIGNVQTQLYHRPKPGGNSVDDIQKQIRAFILNYFMRVSVYRTPQPEPDGPAAPGPLKYLSQFPTPHDYKLQGFGYSQRYFKKRGATDVGKFKESEQQAILPLETLRDDYEWSMIRNPIVNFQVNIRPLGVRGPDLTLPVPTAVNWLVMSPDTITIDDSPGGDLVGRYGIGYSFMKTPGKPELFAYGPGQLEPTVQTLTWEVHKSGDVTVKMVFVSGAPKALFSLSANPLDWAFVAADLLTSYKFSGALAPLRRAANMVPFSDVKFDPVYPGLRAANLLSFGLAGSRLGISREETNKTLTFVHFLQHYNAVLGSRQTWEMIPDWTDEKNLPPWVKNGESA